MITFGVVMLVIGAVSAFLFPSVGLIFLASGGIVLALGILSALGRAITSSAGK